MSIQVILADGTHKDFIALTNLCSAEYDKVYGAEVMQNYHPLNTLENIFCTVLVYCNGVPCACGGIKRFDDNTVEIKRVFVLPSHRKQGLGELILRRLEEQAVAAGYKRAVLETAKDMTAAQALYRKLGFTFMTNYGPYKGDDLCVCMEKRLMQNI